jgi:HAD superfamily hydrolase (TIGR01509 family)
MQQGIQVADKQVKVIALDFDGVMTHLNIDWRKAKEVGSLVAGLRIESLLDFWRVSFGTDIFRRVSDAIKEFEEEAVDSAKPTKAVEFVKEAMKRGKKVYLVSMQSKPSILKFLSKFNISLTGIFSREDFPTKLEMLRRILEIEEIKPSELVFVDDLGRNLDECGKLGVICVHARGEETIEELFKLID